MLFDLKPRICGLATIVSILFLAVAGAAGAQEGASSASASRARYLGDLGVMPSSREIAVEEFVNYHRHEIGRPKAGEAVAMDVRWGNDILGGGKDAVLQVGLSTALANDRQDLRPLNLSLVIDKSGSMADADKLARVKTALLTLVSQLRPKDVLSIVVFDSDAQVLLPAEKVVDPEAIKSLIREIQPGSSTNLDAGLMLGYREALKNLRKDATNRVILLTDGIANRGVTEPKEIARESLAFNDKGIDLSTIGVGLDLNKDLLRDLAKSGRGLFHFVADSQDIEKVFVKEMQSLISPVASDPNLEIDFAPGTQLQKVYGYEPTIRPSSVNFKLDNMNSGLTQVVLLRFKHSADGSGSPVKVRLKYYDLERKTEVIKTLQCSVPPADGPRDDVPEDTSVTKNYTIALLAQSIHDMAAACEKQQYREAERALNEAIAKTYRRYPNVEDADIKRTLTIAEKYQAVLRKQNGTTDRESDEPNLIPNGDFSQGIKGFSAGMEYILPSPNCLWGGYYTITPVFNNPQLHTLVPAEPYAAPLRRSGKEQVLFANTGGTDAWKLLSTVVPCKPNTTYRLSFQSVSLSGGREWVPTYEIRVNGERSEPQPAGDRTYSEISFLWNSKGATKATISIVRMPIMHGGGIIGIANVSMVQGR